jgi:hypothetical protein
LTRRDLVIGGSRHRLLSLLVKKFVNFVFNLVHANFLRSEAMQFWRAVIIQGVPERLPQRKKQYLGKCDNLNFKEKKVLSQAVIEKRHPKLDQSELSTIKVG